MSHLMFKFSISWTTLRVDLLGPCMNMALQLLVEVTERELAVTCSYPPMPVENRATPVQVETDVCKDLAVVSLASLLFVTELLRTEVVITELGPVGNNEATTLWVSAVVFIYKNKIYTPCGCFNVRSIGLEYLVCIYQRHITK
jgi:hypothetical protein